jgi:putative PEP-CTERM system histidine kinase
MNLQETILIGAIVSTLIPVVAVFIRGRSRHIVMLATLLTTATVSFHLAVVLRLVQIGPQPTPNTWVYVLIASAVPVLLAGYLLSACFGRDDTGRSFRESRRIFLFLGLLGVAFLCMLRHHAFVTGYDWVSRRGTIHLGFLGKAYLSYLLIGIILIGHNLERTYRVSPTENRSRIRLALLGFFGLLSYFTFILATGLLYSSIGMGKLIASGLPIAFASVVVAHGYLRSALADVSAPTSRNVVYSSFTALAAGLLVLSIGLAAQVATWTHWSPDEILIIAFGFLALLIAVLLLFSNRFQRRVRRFIDRNFYVNRYDYQTQWSKITESLESATDRDSVLNRASEFLQDAFAADEISIALRDEASRSIRLVRGKGTGDPEGILGPNAPLFQELSRGQKALLLDRKSHDFTYIPIYAENHGWLDVTASQIVAPLLDGGNLIGTIGLERRAGNDPFTFEDVDLLDSISAHIAAALSSMRLAQQLAETREIELMSQWSSMVLHDLKNYLTPLRMVATNMVELKDDPESIALCARDVDRVTDRMEKLVHTLSDLRKSSELRMKTLCPNEIVRETLSEMQITRRPSIKIDLHLDAQHSIRADRDMLRRVLENLITNAIEAMKGSGTLSITTKDYQGNPRPKVHLEVADTGSGIPEDFIREKLFRPFATTKKKGLGLGLYQCRSIVHAHGGALTVESRLDEGSVFHIALNADSPQE